jgi:hypothetical protein
MLNSLYINGVACDQSETGTGKTYVAAWIAKNLNSPVVIVCPKVVIPSWTKVLSYFGIKAHCLINYEKLIRGNTEHLSFKDGKDNSASDYIINFPKNSLVILDEVHKCKGKKSLAGECLIALKNAGYKLLMLSASAATNVTEMKAFGYATLLHSGYGYFDFCKDNGVDFNRFGAMTWDADARKCKDGMLRIHNTLYSTVNCASRMNRKDFGDIFPDNQVIADSFDLGSNTSKLKSVYAEMEYELMNLEEDSKEYSEHVFAIIMKARRNSEILKVPSMVNWIIDMYREGVSPVVFVNFTETLEAIEKRLIESGEFTGKISKIVGGQSPKTRNNEIENFQKDITRVCLVMIPAVAASVSLHDLNGNYPRHTLINPSYSAINTLQSLGRCHRANGKTPVIQRFFFAEGVEIEERMRQRVNLRLTNLDCLNDGDFAINN